MWLLPWSFFIHRAHSHAADWASARGEKVINQFKTSVFVSLNSPGWPSHSISSTSSLRRYWKWRFQTDFFNKVKICASPLSWKRSEHWSNVSYGPNLPTVISTHGKMCHSKQGERVMISGKKRYFIVIKIHHDQKWRNHESFYRNVKFKLLTEASQTHPFRDKKKKNCRLEELDFTLQMEITFSGNT